MGDSSKQNYPTIRDVLWGIAGAFFIAGLLLWLLELVSRLHWGVGAALGAAIAAGVVWISFKASRALGRTPIGYVTVALSLSMPFISEEITPDIVANRDNNSRDSQLLSTPFSPGDPVL
jgi:hypothetical protein